MMKTRAIQYGKVKLHISMHDVLYRLFPFIDYFRFMNIGEKKPIRREDHPNQMGRPLREAQIRRGNTDSEG
jgi:hypothetical protein